MCQSNANQMASGSTIFGLFENNFQTSQSNYQSLIGLFTF